MIIAGPCALESIQQVTPIVELFKKYGLSYFRAHLFKPRTSPHSFQGLGKEGVKILEFLLQNKMKPVCEAASLEQLIFLKDYAFTIQVGARNMQNFELLKVVGKKILPHQEVVLKRGFANNLGEWLSAAQYLEKGGVAQGKIILCERGSRNETSPSGVNLDFPLALKAKRDSPYRVIIDPSHGTKESSLVLPMARAALALNFDGLMIETHPFPKQSLSDPQQAITPEDLSGFLQELQAAPLKGDLY